MHRCLFTLSLLLAAFQTPTVFADDGPAEGVPELQVLSNYVGTWDVGITSDGSPFAKGASTAKWILDGRFVQQSGHLSSADGVTTMKITTLMTYDQDKRTYRMWSFLSDGTSIESVGKWDARKRTMTSVRRDRDTTTTTTATFNDKGIEEWEIVSTNKENEVVDRLAGKNTRRKE